MHTVRETYEGDIPIARRDDESHWGRGPSENGSRVWDNPISACRRIYSSSVCSFSFWVTILWASRECVHYAELYEWSMYYLYPHASGFILRRRLDGRRLPSSHETEEPSDGFLPSVGAVGTSPGTQLEASDRNANHGVPEAAQASVLPPDEVEHGYDEDEDAETRGLVEDAGTDSDSSDEFLGESMELTVSADIGAVRKPVRILSEGEMWGLLQCAGLRRLTRDSCESVRRYRFLFIIPKVDVRPGMKPPSYRTISRTLRPTVLRKLAIRATHLKYSSDGLQYVSPIEYAIQEFANPVFWYIFQRMSVYEELDGTVDLRGSAEDANVVRSKAWFYGPPQWFNTDAGSCKIAEVDEVCVSLVSALF